MAHPIRTRASNFVYRGPAPGIGDAWVELRDDRSALMVWQLDDAERAAIAAGGTIELELMGYPIPPVALSVGQQRELGPEAAELRDSARAILRAISPGPTRVPPGWWRVSPEHWQRLQATGALDPDRGTVPLLWGRPLMIVEGLPAMDYMLSDATRTPAYEKAP